ncbi:MAG: class I SAM-dependent methyltransferase, partial [Candidatus Omnitrophica bacterium]|nr:class I SAM-dependent methyltransferase [Candidatus Omnitrophota bacterium]
FHPKQFKDFLFLVFSDINESHQMIYGRLKNFEETPFFKQLSSHLIFAQSNLLNRDFKVTRSMETHFLATLVKELKPATIFEIGTYNGFTALHLAVNSPDHCRVYTLDLPPDYNAEQMRNVSYDDMLVIELSQRTVHQRFYKDHALACKITELYGDSFTFDFSGYYGKIDIVFIDGNHSSEYVKKDTENAFKMLSERGVIVWHDFDYIIHKDVFSYLNLLAQKYPIYSVPGTRFAVYLKKSD